MDALKTCVTCHRLRPLDAFNRRSSSSDGLQARCRDCCQVWYAANNVEHKRAVRLRNERVREEYQRRLFAYLLQHPCVDCGERDAVVLEFDHREGAAKEDDVTSLVNALVAWSRIEDEIGKCDVRCANCHRRCTARRAEQRRHRWQRALEADEQRVLEESRAQARADASGEML